MGITMGEVQEHVSTTYAAVDDEVLVNFFNKEVVVCTTDDIFVETSLPWVPHSVACAGIQQLLLF